MSRSSSFFVRKAKQGDVLSVLDNRATAGSVQIANPLRNSASPIRGSNVPPENAPNGLIGAGFWRKKSNTHVLLNQSDNPDDVVLEDGEGLYATENGLVIGTTESSNIAASFCIEGNQQDEGEEEEDDDEQFETVDFSEHLHSNLAPSHPLQSAMLADDPPSRLSPRIMSTPPPSLSASSSLVPAPPPPALPPAQAPPRLVPVDSKVKTSFSESIRNRKNLSPAVSLTPASATAATAAALHPKYASASASPSASMPTVANSAPLRLLQPPSPSTMSASATSASPSTAPAAGNTTRSAARHIPDRKPFPSTSTSDAANIGPSSLPVWHAGHGGESAISADKLPLNLTSERATCHSTPSFSLAENTPFPAPKCVFIPRNAETVLSFSRVKFIPYTGSAAFRIGGFSAAAEFGGVEDEGETASMNIGNIGTTGATRSSTLYQQQQQRLVGVGRPLLQGVTYTLGPGTCCCILDGSSATQRTSSFESAAFGSTDGGRSTSMHHLPQAPEAAATLLQVLAGKARYLGMVSGIICANGERLGKSSAFYFTAIA
jgi:hypothetical protein